MTVLPLNPEGIMRIARPARLYSTLARAEMITWTLLILGMILKYAAGLDRATSVTGAIHGFVFLCYALVTVLVAIDKRWALKDLAMGLGSAVIPYLTVPFERSAERRGLVDGDWRLLDPSTANGPHERLVSWALTKPVIAALASLVAVVIVYSLLLLAGPPWQWFS